MFPSFPSRGCMIYYCVVLDLSGVLLFLCSTMSFFFLPYRRFLGRFLFFQVSCRRATPFLCLAPDRLGHITA